MQKKLLNLCFFIAFFSTVIQAQEWEQLGPVNTLNQGIGVCNQVYIHQDNSVFASSPDGGLWLSDDYNRPNWHPLTDTLPNLEIRCFVVSKTNSSQLFLALRHNYLYHSNDKGRSWSRIPYPKHITRINCMALDHHDNTLWLGASNGLYKININTLHTIPVLEDKDITDIAIDPDDDKIIYIGARYIGLLKSKDSGNVFNNILQCHQTNINDKKIPSMIKISLGRNDYKGVAEGPQNRTVAVKMGVSVQVSRDAGSHFNNIDRNRLLTREDGGGSSTRTETLIGKDWNNAIAVDPFNNTRILVGQERIYLNTADSIVSVFNNIHEDFHSFAYHPLIRDILMVANDGGIYVSKTSELKFYTNFQNLAVAQVLRVAVKSDKIVANLDHNGIYGSTPGNLSEWQRIVNPECGYRNNAMESHSVYDDHLSPDQFFVCSYELGSMRYPHPNTNAQNPCKADLLPLAPFRVFGLGVIPNNTQGSIVTHYRMAGEKHYKYIWVCGDLNDTLKKYFLAYTEHGLKHSNGKSRNDFDRSSMPLWHHELDTMTYPVVCLQYHEGSKTINGINSEGRLYYAQIQAETSLVWHQSSALPEISSKVLHFVMDSLNDSIIYLLTENQIFKTINKGNKWTKIRCSVPSTSFYSLRWIRDKTLLLSTSDGIYGSADDFNNTTKLNNNSLPYAKALQMQVTGHKLYVSTYGRGVWFTDYLQLIKKL